MLSPYFALPRTVYLLCLGSFINRAGTFLVPFLALYLTSALGLGQGFATLALGLYGAGGLVAALVGGALADRIGRRTVMLISLVGAAGLLLVFGRITQPSAILAAVLVFAFLGEMYRPAAAAMMADLTQPEQRPTAFGLMYVTVNLGMTVSPIVGGFIAEHSYQWLFWGDAGTSLAYALLLFLAVPETLVRRRGTAAEPADHPSLGEVLRSVTGNGPFLVFCAATFGVSVAYMQSHTTLPLYMQGLGHGPRTYGLVVAVNAAMVALCQLPFTALIRPFPREHLLVTSAVLTGVGFGLTGLATTPVALALTVVVWTFGEMMQSAYLPAVVADLAPPAMRGSYMGMLSFSFAGALMLGAPAGGFLLEHGGAGWLWAATCGVALLGALLYATVGSRIRRAAT